MLGKVLTIAGSDSGGGAGIQADIKTINSLGCYACSAITALTAQNTLGVHEVFDVSPTFLKKQIDVVLSDIGADYIKIGMLNDTKTIEAVSEVLSKYDQIPIILDTVMIAKGGCVLLKQDSIENLKDKLIKKSFLVTPNIPEAEILSKTIINDVDDMIIAAKNIIKFGTKNVLLKGGHLDGDTVFDILLKENGKYQIFQHKKLSTKNTHGTGCTLSAAISAFMAKGYNLSESVKEARLYVFDAIKNCHSSIGRGNGPLNHSVLIDH